MKMILNSFKKRTRKFARMIKNIKKYFTEIIREVAQEERSTIKKHVASTFKKSVQVLCIGFILIVVIIVSATVRDLRIYCNVSVESIEEVITAVNTAV